jgi:hypothetical protein
MSRLSPGCSDLLGAAPGDTASIASRCIRFPGAAIPFGPLWGFGSTALNERCVLLSVALKSDAPGGSCSGGSSPGYTVSWGRTAPRALRAGVSVFRVQRTQVMDKIPPSLNTIRTGAVVLIRLICSRALPNISFPSHGAGWTIVS